MACFPNRRNGYRQVIGTEEKSSFTGRMNRSIAILGPMRWWPRNLEFGRLMGNVVAGEVIWK